MNQIALGDAAAGWLILSGLSAAPPFKRASYATVFSSTPMVADTLTLSLEGTPDQISGGLAALEKAQQLAELYQRAAGNFISPRSQTCGLSSTRKAMTPIRRGLSWSRCTSPVLITLIPTP